MHLFLDINSLEAQKRFVLVHVALLLLCTFLMSVYTKGIDWVKHDNTFIT